MSNLIKDLGPVSLIVDLTVGWGQSVVAAMMSHSDTASMIPVLAVTNNADHTAHVLETLDAHVLRALRSPGHKLHEEALEREIAEAFPNLCALAAAPADEDTGDVDMQDFDAADEDADCDD